MTHTPSDAPATRFAGDAVYPAVDEETPGSNPILWALYLGMSWTWVIGMFLPVLLVRDYGPVAWWIFAIPNCVGAAAMGWVLRSPGQSRDLVERHLVACRVFSLVTIAFQLFVIVWRLPLLVGPIGWITAALVVQIAFTPLLRRTAPVAAIVVFVISAAIAMYLIATQKLMLPETQVMRPADMIGLSLVCLLGFVLCPYLDLTFHHARQSTSRSGAKIAFGLGFCGFFASMIVFTLWYASSILHVLPGTVTAWLLMIHLSVQVIFTVLVHARVLYDDSDRRGDTANTRAALGVALGLGLFAGMLAYFFASHGVHYARISVGEVIYRLFMAFYGLVFPAYMVISFIKGRPMWRWTLIVVAIAMPFYYLAFIEQNMSWVTVGVAVVAVAGAAAWVSSRRGLKASAAAT